MLLVGLVLDLLARDIGCQIYDSKKTGKRHDPEGMIVNKLYWTRCEIKGTFP
jgi:hypothetical protein